MARASAVSDEVVEGRWTDRVRRPPLDLAPPGDDRIGHRVAGVGQAGRAA